MNRHLGRFSSLVMACVLSVLMGCGGGASAPGISAFLGPESLVAAFSYYRDGSVNNPVSYMYAQDIDGDGVDEVFLVAFETQPNTPDQYSNTEVRILGWRAGVLQDVTAQWLPDGQNRVEGVGDVVFGDFDGDGRKDAVLSAYTDMDHPVNAYALMNRGDHLERVTLGSATWQHALAVGDINGDGFDDVVVAGYSDFPQFMGSAQGLVAYRGMVGSSGVALGDFLGRRDGSLQAIFVDADMQPDGRSGVWDTGLYALQVQPSDRTLSLTRLAALPMPRLAPREDAAHSSHDIRARAVDFDADGRLDVVVFSYFFMSGQGDSENAYRSEIQFLRNTGEGRFEDVTATVRQGYDTTGYVGYTPQFRDFNGDGRVDVFTSQPDFFASGLHKSTTLLLQQPDGRFVDSHRAELSANIDSGGGQAVLAKGPQSRWYLVKESRWQRDGLSRVWAQPVLRW